MNSPSSLFPYDSYRPYQREMLQLAAACAADGGIAMIDAPTGSGKSSVISALLENSRGRKVIVAVRTVSQLNTFIRELQLIREKKKKDLKFAYIIGKSNVCPLGGTGNIYRRCEGVKAYSTALMRERAHKGSRNLSKDPIIRRQISRMDREKPLICPYFIGSRTYTATDDGGLRMVPGEQLRLKATKFGTTLVSPEHLAGFFGSVCPYEMMLAAARDADVVVVNFYHLFDADIREQLYASLDVDVRDAILLMDEAHNCGDVIQAIQSVAITERDIELAGHELAVMRRTSRQAEGIVQVLPQIRTFMDMVKKSREREDWFDPAIFSRMLLSESIMSSLEGLVDDLLSLSEKIKEKNMKTGDFRESAVERLTEFLYRIYRSGADPAFLTVYSLGDDGSVSLEVRNIDPSETLQEIATSHAVCVLISGTLAPIEAYRKYYFGDLPVESLTLPNAFPPEKRIFLCARDITSIFSQRRDPKNVARIGEYIAAFCTLGGNLAVYFPSYEMLNTFSDICVHHIRGKKVFIEPKDAAEAHRALLTFMSLPERGDYGVLFAVCGGKWSEGLDYRGEMLSGAMVIGLPLAPYTRIRRMVIDYFRHKFGVEGEFISYTLPAINRALQAIGRVLRTPEDRGFLVLGERRFLDTNIRAGLPPWMHEEILPCDIEEFRREVARWR